MSDNDEKTLLLERAKVLGISHSPNIGVEALKAKITAFLNDQPDPGEGTTATVTDAATTVLTDTDVAKLPKPEKLPKGVIGELPIVKQLTPLQMQQEEREKQWSEQLRLVRCRITNLNPAKAVLRGEIFTVANDYVGTVKKFIPYGEATEQGYHLPFILFNELKARMYNSIKTKRLPNGQEEIMQRLVPEFAIEQLPDLTEDERAVLARTQAAAAGMSPQ